MKYIEYKEHRQQGTFNFPIAFYHETPHSPRYVMPLHWHPEFEIIRIISGSMHLSINNTVHLVQEGDVVLVTDGVLHGGQPFDCVYESIVFDLHILLKDNHACAKTIHEILDHQIMINLLISKDHPEICQVVRSLSHALSSKQTGYEFMTQGYLYQLLGLILSHHLYEISSTNRQHAERMNSMKKVLAFIAENYASDISLDTLSKIAGMNPKYFCRYFRSMTERTPIDYLNYFRIECACEMLMTQNVSIKETAISCGFNDESYFIKTFNKYKGMTPKQYMSAAFHSGSIKKESCR